MIDAFGVERDDIAKAMSDTQLRHRKRIQAGLSTAGALVGLSALGAKGVKAASSSAKLGAKIDSGVNNALVAGAGIGGAAGLNSASILRAEGKKKPSQIGKANNGDKEIAGGAALVGGGVVTRKQVRRQAGRVFGPNGPGTKARSHADAGEVAHDEATRVHHLDQGNAYIRDAEKAVKQMKSVKRGGNVAIGVGLAATAAGAHKKVSKAIETTTVGNQHKLKHKVVVTVPKLGEKGRRHVALGLGTASLAAASLAAPTSRKKALGLITAGSGLTAYAASEPGERKDHIHVKKSAFGIVEKSEVTPGNYKPTSQLSRRERAQAQHLATNSHVRSQHREDANAIPKGSNIGSGLGGVYQRHGVGPSIDQAVKAKSRPSKVHPKIEYGESVSHHLENQIDRHIDPKLAASSPHKVVFHHLETEPSTFAAAAGAHRVTGGKGHVIINHSAVSSEGKNIAAVKQRVSVKGLVNHELAHASKKDKNPFSLVSRGPKSSMGEEARADAHGVPGRGAYRRQKVVAGKAKTSAFERAGAKFKDKSPVWEVIHQNTQNHVGYHKVHDHLRSSGIKPGSSRTAENLHYLNATKGKNIRRAVYAGAAIGAVQHHKKANAVKKNDPFELGKRFVSEGQRKKLAAKGDALPGGGFPIKNASDLANAKRAVGRAKNPEAARRLINRRAKQLGQQPIGKAVLPTTAAGAAKVGTSTIVPPTKSTPVKTPAIPPTPATAPTGAPAPKAALKPLKPLVAKSAFGIPS